MRAGRWWNEDGVIIYDTGRSPTVTSGLYKAVSRGHSDCGIWRSKPERGGEPPYCQFRLSIVCSPWGHRSDINRRQCCLHAMAAPLTGLRQYMAGNWGNITLRYGAIQLRQWDSIPGWEAGKAIKSIRWWHIHIQQYHRLGNTIQTKKFCVELF